MKKAKPKGKSEKPVERAARSKGVKSIRLATLIPGELSISAVWNMWRTQNGEDWMRWNPKQARKAVALLAPIISFERELRNKFKIRTDNR